MAYNKPTQETKTPVKAKPIQQKAATQLEIKKFQGEFKATYPDSEGTKQDGTPWERVAVVFKKQDGTDKIFKVFTPLNWKQGTIQPSEMKKGRIYEIGYTQKDFTDSEGNEKKSNQPKYILEVENLTEENKEDTIPVNYNVAGLNVLPEEQQLWDNSNFKTLNQWLQVAEASGIFDDEERAKSVYSILSQQ